MPAPAATRSPPSHCSNWSSHPQPPGHATTSTSPSTSTWPPSKTGRHTDTLCELSDASPIAVATARRLACDANIIPIVLNGHGIPLDVGRTQRLATPEQRAALRAMYRTCGVGDCDTNFDRCDIHHLNEWEHSNGPTDLHNLIPACSYHHHRAHEGRWHLELRPHDRQLTVWLPDGTLHSQSLPDILVERTRHDRPNAA
jgi:Domain of unknown function (DUF222)